MNPPPRKRAKFQQIDKASANAVKSAPAKIFKKYPAATTVKNNKKKSTAATVATASVESTAATVPETANETAATVQEPTVTATAEESMQELTDENQQPQQSNSTFKLPNATLSLQQQTNTSQVTSHTADKQPIVVDDTDVEMLDAPPIYISTHYYQVGDDKGNVQQTFAPPRNFALRFNQDTYDQQGFKYHRQCVSHDDWSKIWNSDERDSYVQWGTDIMQTAYEMFEHKPIKAKIMEKVALYDWHDSFYATLGRIDDAARVQQFCLARWLAPNWTKLLELTDHAEGQSLAYQYRLRRGRGMFDVVVPLKSKYQHDDCWHCCDAPESYVNSYNALKRKSPSKETDHMLGYLNYSLNNNYKEFLGPPKKRMTLRIPGKVGFYMEVKVDSRAGNFVSLSEPECDAVAAQLTNSGAKDSAMDAMGDVLVETLQSLSNFRVCCTSLYDMNTLLDRAKQIHKFVFHGGKFGTVISAYSWWSLNVERLKKMQSADGASLYQLAKAKYKF